MFQTRQRRLVTAFAFLLATLGVLAGCDGDGSDERPVFEAPEEPIEVDAGERFAIALDANSSTGYEWRVADASGGIRFQGSDYEPDPGSEDYAGGGGTQTLDFRAGRRGKAEIRLVYVFTGGERREPAQRRVIEVRIR